MASPLLHEHRILPRRRMIGFMPGQLYTVDRHQEFYCRPLDVSPYGMGVFTEDCLEEFGHDFILVIAEHEIELILVWTIENPGDKVGYRHGFKAKDSRIDLEKLCLLNGYL